MSLGFMVLVWWAPLCLQLALGLLADVTLLECLGETLCRLCPLNLQLLGLNLKATTSWLCDLQQVIQPLWVSQWEHPTA